MVDEFWQDKELLSSEREADPPTAISVFLSVFRHTFVGSVLDGYQKGYSAYYDQGFIERDR